MAHTPKHTTPSQARSAGVPIPVATGSAGSADMALSSRVVALKKLVAAGQYQVSPRHLAHQIMRAAGIRPL